MRVANLVVSVLGLVGVAVAVAMAWRWRRVPLIAARRSPTSWPDTLSDAMRTLGAVVSAGVVAGLLVLGLGGRLVMRLLAATSGSAAQGRLTEAGERVGEITVDGTMGFLVFVGLGGGLVTAFAYLVVRRWLPNTAGAAGSSSGSSLSGRSACWIRCHRTTSTSPSSGRRGWPSVLWWRPACCLPARTPQSPLASTISSGDPATASMAPVRRPSACGHPTVRRVQHRLHRRTPHREER